VKQSRWVPVVDQGRALGTSYDVLVLAQQGDEARARRDLAAVRALCDRLEDQLSEWKPDSELSRVNRLAGEGPVKLSPLLERLLVGAQHVAQATGGAFDVTWAPLGRLWDDAERRGRVPTESERLAALTTLGHRRVHVQDGRVWFDRPGVQLGIASFGKGAIIDLLFEALRSRGYQHLVVNLGGDLRTGGLDADGEPWCFRVVDPDRPAGVAAELLAHDVAIATSGNSFRARRIQGERFGHLLDVSTGWPAAFDGSVTVLARDAAMADALATALLVMGPERGLAFARHFPQLEALFLSRDGRVATDGLASAAPHP